MSTSLKVVSIAAVLCASTSRRAIVARRFDMRTRSSVRSPDAARGFSATGGAGLRRGAAAGGAAAGAGGGAALAAACSTSRFITRPASPLPRTLARSTSCSSAALRAVGVARGVFAGAAAGAGSRRAFGRGWRPPSAAARRPAPRRRRPRPASSITPSTSPTFTSSPSCRAIRLSTPACGALTSRSILSVSSSTSGSPAATDVAFLAQPLGDAGVDNRLADFGHDDV